MVINSYKISIQLIRQMLSHKSVKAYVTMPSGITGGKSLALLGMSLTVFDNKEIEGINTLVCALSLHVT